MRVWVEEPRPARGDGELARGLWGAQHIQLQGGGSCREGAAAGEQHPPSALCSAQAQRCTRVAST